MNPADLPGAIEKLKLELLNIGPVDPETQERIDALLVSLDDPDNLTLTEDENASLQELLSDSVTHFESSHPTLTGLLSQVMSLLNSIGI